MLAERFKRRSFNKMDKDGDGFVSGAEFVDFSQEQAVQAFEQESGKKMTDEMIQEIAQQAEAMKAEFLKDLDVHLLNL